MAEITVERILEYIGRLSAADRVKLFAILTTEAPKPAKGTTTGQKKLEPLPIPGRILSLAAVGWLPTGQIIQVSGWR
jgi:hypothetical protein